MPACRYNGKQEKGPGDEHQKEALTAEHGNEVERVFDIHIFFLGIVLQLGDHFTIYAMVFVFNTIQILQVGAHLPGSLGYLGHLDMFKLIKIKDGLAHFVIEQGVATGTLKLRQNAHSVTGDGSGALHFQQ